MLKKHFVGVQYMVFVMTVIDLASVNHFEDISSVERHLFCS
jgi:hypothetical protein